MFYQLSPCLVWEAEEWEERKESSNTQKVSLKYQQWSTSVSFVKKQMGKIKNLKYDVNKNFLNQ